MTSWRCVFSLSPTHLLKEELVMVDRRRQCLADFLSDLISLKPARDIDREGQRPVMRHFCQNASDALIEFSLWNTEREFEEIRWILNGVQLRRDVQEIVHLASRMEVNPDGRQEFKQDNLGVSLMDGCEQAGRRDTLRGKILVFLSFHLPLICSAFDKDGFRPRLIFSGWVTQRKDAGVRTAVQSLLFIGIKGLGLDSRMLIKARQVSSKVIPGQVIGQCTRNWSLWYWREFWLVRMGSS